MFAVAKAGFKEPTLKVRADKSALLLALRNTETVFELEFAVAKSGLPSPSKSPIANK